jgi:hypothetical protein
MTTFNETKQTATSELNWLINKTVVSATYDECVEKKFVGRLNYSMVMKAIKNNKWGEVSEGGQGKNAWWLAQSMNAGLIFHPSTGKVEFTYYEGK